MNNLAIKLKIIPILSAYFIFSNPLIAEVIRDDRTGTATDQQTAIEWLDIQQIVRLTWPNAIRYCEELEIEHKSDWRLPNLNEFKSILFRSDQSKPIKTGFENFTLLQYWTSTTLSGDRDRAWFVNLDNGGFIHTNTKSSMNYVKCIRGGQMEIEP